ncbi:hypothetical protein CBW46_016865 [Paenibacillus xerothermodurans]|uniref:Uncharacterized protein n=1 Tax=Paenibacillus xerothermodurans TaxID=1977292 RepID=A0A2W1N861_PAEXE|nr:hypothetical protein CBW46_016865 [Paenibacillus xerothermodurans]
MIRHARGTLGQREQLLYVSGIKVGHAHLTLFPSATILSIPSTVYVVIVRFKITTGSFIMAQWWMLKRHLVRFDAIHAN